MSFPERLLYPANCRTLRESFSRVFVARLKLQMVSNTYRLRRKGAIAICEKPSRLQPAKGSSFARSLCCCRFELHLREGMTADCRRRPHWTRSPPSVCPVHSWPPEVRIPVSCSRRFISSFIAIHRRFVSSSVGEFLTRHAFHAGIGFESCPALAPDSRRVLRVDRIAD